MWVIQKLEAYLSEESAPYLPAVEIANIFLTLALFSQQTNMLLLVFWCVCHCPTKEHCLLWEMFSVWSGSSTYMIVASVLTPVFHMHSWTCLLRRASPVSRMQIGHPKVALDSAPFLSTALSRFCCEGALYSLSFKPPQKWWVNFRRMLWVQRAFVGCFGTAVLLVLLKKVRLGHLGVSVG